MAVGGSGAIAGTVAGVLNGWIPGWVITILGETWSMLGLQVDIRFVTKHVKHWVCNSLRLKYVRYQTHESLGL